MSTGESPARPRVLAIVDAPGWAHDAKTLNLARALAPRYEIARRLQDEVLAAELETADLILVYYWHQFDRMAVTAAELQRHRRKLLCGICGHYEIEGPLRAPGLSALERHAAGVFVNNRSLHAEFAPLLALPLFYTPNGVDTGFFCPAGDPDAPREPRGATEAPGARVLRVGWAGSLSNQGRDGRGLDDYVVPAVARLPGVELRTAIREERWRNWDEMLEFYRRLDVYVCASRLEGTPNPCLEAAACGVPLVSTRVGNMPDFIEEGTNGFLVDRDVEAIAARLARLKEDPELRDSMGRAARRTALAWDWQAQAVNYREMFDSMLGGLSSGTVR
jgi:glycosyltransferase involved in cell wall biosynthesis